MNTGKSFFLAAAVAIALATVGCGANGGHGEGTSTNGPNPPQNDFAGAWEFVFTSAAYPQGASGAASGGNIFLVDTIITQNGSSLTSSGAQVQLASFLPKGASGTGSTGQFQPVGLCNQSSANSSITGTAQTKGTQGVSAEFSFNLGGVVYNATAFVNADGTLTGTYTGGAGACGGDAGYINATGVQPLAGTYNGVLTSYGSVTTTFKEASNYNLNVTGIPVVSLTGSTIGNVGMLTGSMNGINANLWVYYDSTGTYASSFLPSGSTSTGPAFIVYDGATFAFDGLL